MSLLRWMLNNRVTSAYVLFAVAAAAIAGMVTVGVRLGWSEQLLYVIWLGAFATLLLAGGLYQWLRTPDPVEDLTCTRMTFLGVFAGSGLLLALLGFGIALQERDTFFQLVKTGVGETTGPLWIAIAAISATFFGLFIAFLSVQVNQNEERSDPVLRRLLYGYNTALTSLLLLLIIVAGNVFAFAALPNLIDFTKTGANSLDTDGPAAKIVKSMERPVKIYSILDDDGLSSESTRVLLQNLRELAGPDKLEIETLPRDPRNKTVRELLQKYKFSETGLLLVAGGGKDGEEQHTFIRQSDLTTSDPPMGGGPPTIKYVGESKLLAELAFLADNKAKPVIYITQGHGEPDLNDTSADKIDSGLGELARRLRQRNIEIKPLTLDPITPTIPEDASVVAIIGPRSEFTADQVKALRTYAQPPADSGRKPGKLLVMLHGRPEGGKFPETGLAGLLYEVGVDLPSERVLSWMRSANINGQIVTEGNRSPAMLFASAGDPSGPAKNAITDLLGDAEVVLYDARIVRPTEGGTALGAPKATVLLSAIPPVFAEADLKRSVSEAVYNAYRETAQRQADFIKPIPVAVTVSAGEGPDAKPRMVVIGSTFPASNYVHQNESDSHFNLVAGSIDWLRERPTFGDITPRMREVVKLEGKNAFGSLPWQPLGLMLAGIAALGGGVWIVRRR